MCSDASGKPLDIDDERLVVLTWSRDDPSRRGSVARRDSAGAVPVGTVVETQTSRRRRHSLSQPPVRVDIAEEMCQPCGAVSKRMEPFQSVKLVVEGNITNAVENSLRSGNCVRSLAFLVVFEHCRSLGKE